jgi:hypothetical protein
MIPNSTHLFSHWSIPLTYTGIPVRLTHGMNCVSSAAHGGSTRGPALAGRPAPASALSRRRAPCRHQDGPRGGEPGQPGP